MSDLLWNHKIPERNQHEGCIPGDVRVDEVDVERAHLHVCRPRTAWIRSEKDCPICKARTRFVGADALYYGVTWTCCGCGDSWSEEGELLERPFKRAWRKTAIATAEHHWNNAMTREEHLAWLEAQLHIEETPQ